MAPDAVILEDISRNLYIYWCDDLRDTGFYTMEPMTCFSALKNPLKPLAFFVNLDNLDDVASNIQDIINVKICYLTKIQQLKITKKFLGIGKEVKFGIGSKGLYVE